MVKLDFGQNHGKKFELKNFEFLNVSEASIFWSKKYSFLSRILKNDLFWHDLQKSKHCKKIEFLTKDID